LARVLGVFHAKQKIRAIPEFNPFKLRDAASTMSFRALGL